MHRSESPERGARHRVAHLLPWDGVGGTEFATLRIAEAVRGSGIDSVAYCLEGAVPVQDFFRSSGVETAQWRLAHPVLGEARAYAAEAWRLSREFKRRGIHLVHCADVRAAGSVGAVAARLAGIAVICHVRNRNELTWAPARRPLRMVDRFLFVSRETWRRFGYPVPAARGEVVYDGFDAPAEPPAGLAEREATRKALGVPVGARLVGMVARVEPQKDFATLARAAARLVAARPDAHVVVVGGTVETEEQRRHYPEVRRWMAEAGVERHVTFAGFRTDMDRVLRALDVFVLSTHWEGLPLVILEAMAHGLPVVATAVDGVPEAVRDGETGWLVPHADAHQLATRLLQLLNDQQLAERFGDAGRRLVQTQFSRDQFARTMQRVYAMMLGIPELAVRRETTGTS